jgi:hypothetical protein
MPQLLDRAQHASGASATVLIGGALLLTPAPSQPSWFLELSVPATAVQLLSPHVALTTHEDDVVRVWDLSVDAIARRLAATTTLCPGSSTYRGLSNDDVNRLMRSCRAQPKTWMKMPTYVEAMARR